MEKINLKKDRFILIINNEENIFYYGLEKGETDKDGLVEILKENNNKIKNIHIFITDNNIFVENFKVNVSRSGEAKSAALNMLLLNSVNNKEDITFKKVLVKKVDNKEFLAVVYYTYLNLEWLFNILNELKIEKKLEGIYPLVQLFFEKENFCYNIKEHYYTYIEDIYNVAIFRNMNNKILPENVVVKEFGLDELEVLFDKLDNKLELNFIDSGKYEFVEKIFIPLVILIVVINLTIFTFLNFKKSKLNKQLETIKTQVSQELKELEPFQKASEKYEKINKMLEVVNRFKNSNFPFNKVVEDLSRIKQIWIRQMSLNRGRFLISGKAESAFKVLEIIKKMPFLEDAKINSKIIRDNKGFERFTIRAKYKNEFKD